MTVWPVRVGRPQAVTGGVLVVTVRVGDSTR